MRRPGPVPAAGQPGLELRELALIGGVVAIAVLGIYATRPRRIERRIGWRR